MGNDEINSYFRQIVIFYVTWSHKALWGIWMNTSRSQLQHRSQQCQRAQTGATDGRLWSGDSSVQSYGREVMKTWLDSHYMLFRFTDELFLLRAGVPNSSQSLSTESHVSRFTAPDSLINDSASLELASDRLPAPPQHDVMSFSAKTPCSFPRTN